MSNSLSTVLSVFIGGGVGSVIRFLVSQFIPLLTTRIWVGTLIVNVLGAFLIFLISYKISIPENFKPLIRIGFLGGLTTFSTFSFEVVNAFRSGHIAESIAIFSLNVLFGIVIAIWIFR